MAHGRGLEGERCDVCGRRATLLYVASSGVRDEAGNRVYDLVADVCDPHMHTLREIVEAAKRRRGQTTECKACGGVGRYVVEVSGHEEECFGCHGSGRVATGTAVQ